MEWEKGGEEREKKEQRKEIHQNLKG